MLHPIFAIQYSESEDISRVHKHTLPVWYIFVGVRVMVFNDTFRNISAILWLSVLFVEETGVHGENNRLAASYWQT